MVRAVRATSSRKAGKATADADVAEQRTDETAMPESTNKKTGSKSANTKEKDVAAAHSGESHEDSQDGSDSEDNGGSGDDIEDPELDRLVNKSLLAIKKSKITSSSKIFNKLAHRLLDTQMIASTPSSETSVASISSHRESAIEQAQRQSSLYNPNDLVNDPLNRPKPVKPNTVGKGWFDMKPMEMTEQLKREVQMIRMRNYVDPKRFYKNPDKIGAVLHVGTVIEGPSEYKSSRLTNKERKQSIVDEILSDQMVGDYTKRKYMEIQDKNQRKLKFFKKPKKVAKLRKERKLF